MNIEFEPNYREAGISTPDRKPVLKAYLNRVSPEIGRRYRTAVIVLPGGAYENISYREGEPVAIRFQAYGMQAFVLEYSVNTKYPMALIELAEAIRTIRKNADQYDIDADKIVLCGFSAGGHLAANIGTCWDNQILRCLYEDTGDIKPNALILCYPVITAVGKTHPDSIKNLLGEQATQNDKEAISLELKVNGQTPPVFLWHCADDTIVPVINSIMFSNALSNYDVNFEMHIFPKGGHGLSLADECVAASENQIDNGVSSWFHLMLQWIREVFG